MRKEFEIDGVTYVAIFNVDHELIFYADALKSEKVVYKQNAFERAFGDESPLQVFCDTQTGYAFKVKQEVLKFVEQMIRHHNPYYFTYSTFDDDRVSLYGKIAKRLCEKYGYYVTNEDGVFRFVKRNW
ncbi:MAG: hypothetical protein ACO36I_18225 [Candidatus Latescibacterota bacterium]